MITRAFAGRLYDRYGHIVVFLPGTSLILIAMLLLFWLPNSFILFLAAALYGLGFGTVQPALQAWAIDKASTNRKGMANATFFSFFDLGVGIGAIVFGQIAFLFYYDYIYLTAAFSIFSSMAIYLGLLVRLRFVSRPH